MATGPGTLTYRSAKAGDDSRRTFFHLAPAVFVLLVGVGVSMLLIAIVQAVLGARVDLSRSLTNIPELNVFVLLFGAAALACLFVSTAMLLDRRWGVRVAMAIVEVLRVVAIGGTVCGLAVACVDSLRFLFFVGLVGLCAFGSVSLVGLWLAAVERSRPVHLHTPPDASDRYGPGWMCQIIAMGLLALLGLGEAIRVVLHPTPMGVVGAVVAIWLVSTAGLVLSLARVRWSWLVAVACFVLIGVAVPMMWREWAEGSHSMLLRKATDVEYGFAHNHTVDFAAVGLAAYFAVVVFGNRRRLLGYAAVPGKGDLARD